MSEVVDPEEPTFQWKTARRPNRARLLLFIFLSTFVHIGFFYLFRIATGTRETPVPRPQSVTLLHPSHPLAAPLIERLIDRATATTGSLRSAASSSLQLSEFAPTYSPSYAGYQPKLRPFPEPDRTRPLPPIHQSSTPILPPVIAPEPIPAPPAQTPSPTLAFSPTLQSRAPSDALDTLASIIKPGTHHVFSIALAPTGHVTHLLAIPGSASAPPPPETLLTAISSLRFAPASSTTAGTLTINR